MSPCSIESVFQMSSLARRSNSHPKRGRDRNCSGRRWSPPLEIQARTACSAAVASPTHSTPSRVMGITTRARRRTVRQEADSTARPRKSRVRRSWSGNVTCARSAAQRIGNRKGRNMRTIWYNSRSRRAKKTAVKSCDLVIDQVGAVIPAFSIRAGTRDGRFTRSTLCRAPPHVWHGGRKAHERRPEAWATHPARL